MIVIRWGSRNSAKNKMTRKKNAQWSAKPIAEGLGMREREDGYFEKVVLSEEEVLEPLEKSAVEFFGDLSDEELGKLYYLVSSRLANKVSELLESDRCRQSVVGDMYISKGYAGIYIRMWRETLTINDLQDLRKVIKSARKICKAELDKGIENAIRLLIRENPWVQELRKRKELKEEMERCVDEIGVKL